MTSKKDLEPKAIRPPMEEGLVARRVEEIYPDTEPELERRMQELSAEINSWMVYISAVMQEEDPSNEVFFAQQLHQAKQYRMMLESKKEFCRVRLNRIRLNNLE